MFGLFKSKKKDTVSRDVAVFLAEKALAAEAELENLAAHSEKLISENDSLTKDKEELASQLESYKGLYYRSKETSSKALETITSQNKTIASFVEELELGDHTIDFLRRQINKYRQDLAASRKACEHMRKTRH